MRQGLSTCWLPSLLVLAGLQACLFPQSGNPHKGIVVGPDMSWRYFIGNSKPTAGWRKQLCLLFRVYGCFRHQVLLRGCGQWFRCGRDRVARPSEQENLDPRPQRNRRRQEDVSKGEPSRDQTGLHSRSSDLTSELQSSVRSDEVVIATEQLQVLIEPLRRASVGKCSSRKVCRPVPKLGPLEINDKSTA